MQFVQVSALCNQYLTEKIAAIKNFKITGWKNVGEPIHSLIC